MNRTDGRTEASPLTRLELIKVLHRNIILEREQANLAALKPLLRADVDAAWDAQSRSR